METGVAIQHVSNQINDQNRESSRTFIAAAAKPLARHLSQEMSYARTFENGSLLLIPLSISTPHLMPTTRVLQHGAPKEIPSQFGNRLAPCYGFTENVVIPLMSASCVSLTISWIDSWLREKYPQVRYPPSSCVPI